MKPFVNDYFKKNCIPNPAKVDANPITPAIPDRYHLILFFSIINSFTLEAVFC